MSWFERIKARKAEEEQQPEPAEGAGEEQQESSGDESPSTDTGEEQEGREEQPQEPAQEQGGDKEQGDNAEQESDAGDAEPPLQPDAMTPGSLELFRALSARCGAEFAARAVERGWSYAQAMDARLAEVEQQVKELEARLENRAGMGEEEPVSMEEEREAERAARTRELERKGLSKGEAAFATKLRLQE